MERKGFCMIASELTFLREAGRKGKEEENNNLFGWTETEEKKKKGSEFSWPTIYISLPN